MKYNQYNLYNPADNTSDIKGFNSKLSFANTAKLISDEERQDAEDAKARMIQCVKNQISKGN